MAISNVAKHYHGSSGVGGALRLLFSSSTKTLPERVAAIGATKSIIEIYGTETIASSLEIPSTITIFMKPGSKLTVNAGILNFEGSVYCEGQDAKFSVAAGAEVIFNGLFEAPLAQVFEGAGLVSFGRHKTELVTNGTFTGSATGSAGNRNRPSSATSTSRRRAE